MKATYYQSLHRRSLYEKNKIYHQRDNAQNRRFNLGKHNHIFLAAESIGWFLPLIFSRILDTILDKALPSLLLFFFAALTAISISVTSAMSYINSKLLLKSHKNMVNFLLERTFSQLSEARDKKGVNYYSNLILKTSGKALNFLI